MSSHGDQEAAKRRRWLTRAGITDMVLVAAFAGLVAFVVAWEWPRGGAGDVIQSEHEIECFVGDVAPGTKSIREVPIQNKTAEPLTIKSVSRSCTCLAIGLDRQTLQPGEAANLKVEFHSPDLQGTFKHELVVSFEGYQEPFTVRVNGTVAAWVRPSVSAVEFGETFPGEASRQRIRLEVLEPWPETERQVKSLMPHTSIESVEAEDDGKAVVYTVAFKPPGDAQIKDSEGYFVVEWLGHEDRGLKLPCYGKIVSEWVAEPPEVLLGKIVSKQPRAFTVQIRNRRHDNDAWQRQYKVSADSGGFVQLSPTWNGKRWRVTGSVQEDGLHRAGLRSAAVCVTAPDGSVPFRVPVYWETER